MASPHKRLSNFHHPVHSKLKPAEFAVSLVLLILQNNVEHQADALEPLIATVCGLAHMPTTPTASAMAAVVGECEEALQVSCLHVVREYIRLYQVLRVLPPKLEILQVRNQTRGPSESVLLTQPARYQGFGNQTLCNVV